jgi:pimeloyl-ACP methyl ester carboxylesterase
MKPVLLLIPGMLNTAHIWRHVVPLLQDDADVRIADVTRQSSIAQMAQDAWALVADVPEDRRLVVCGFSMGGYVALELVATRLADQRAPSTRALALISTSARPETADGMLAREKTIAAVERDFNRVAEGIARLGMHPAHHANADLMAEALGIMREAGAAAALRQLRAVMGRADQRPLLAKIKAATLVVSARDDLVVPPAASEELAAGIAGAKLAWLAPAGHMLPLEQPKQLAAQLKTLL